MNQNIFSDIACVCAIKFLKGGMCCGCKPSRCGRSCGAFSSLAITDSRNGCCIFVHSLVAGIMTSSCPMCAFHSLCCP